MESRQEMDMISTYDETVEFFYEVSIHVSFQKNSKTFLISNKILAKSFLDSNAQA